MELDSRKKGRRARMRSKSLETQEMRKIGQKKAGEFERLSHLMDGNNGSCLPDGRKGM